jgi:hypothetical protein
MPILRYNGSLVIWTVVSLTVTEFKSFVFSMSGFALSYDANIFILMILCDFCLLRNVQPLYQPTVRERNWVWYNGVLVGGVISLSWPCLRIVLPRCWFILLAVTGHHDQLRLKPRPCWKFWDEVRLGAIRVSRKFCRSRFCVLFQINVLALLTSLSRWGVVSFVFLTPGVSLIYSHSHGTHCSPVTFGPTLSFIKTERMHVFSSYCHVWRVGVTDNNGF